MGWSLLAFLSLNMIVNLLFVGIELYHKICLVITKYKNLFIYYLIKHDFIQNENDEFGEINLSADKQDEYIGNGINILQISSTSENDLSDSEENSNFEFKLTGNY